MSRTRKHPKRRKPFHPVKTFFKVMLSIVMVFVVLAGGACFAYHKVTGEWPFGGDTIAKDADETSMLDALLGRNMKLNVAVFGVDADGTRTDVAFVVHYDSSQESLSLLSIPRDTRVDVCPDVEQLLGKRYGVMKFNAVHAIGGKEYGPQAAVLQLEDMLGIKIDHYVKVDFNALVEIVDAVGGVEVDVPQDMKWDMSDTGDIKKGVDYAVVKAICDGTTSGDIVTLAKGVMPQAGADGWYEFFFDTNVKSNPVLMEDGSVDYQNAKWFELVKKGQTVAVYHEAQEGTPGYTIMGESLATKKGKEKPILTGSGFQILEDKKTYIATENGKIELKDNRLVISSLLVLDDVTCATGNVDFDGSIYVRGNVGQGVSIHATRDVLVDGYTESSVIEAGGDIILKKGNNASGRGFLRANGDVMGMFFESARVWAGGKVSANYCLRSEIHAGTRIEISGRNGVLAGGLAQAQNLIQATNIGNEASLATRLVLGNKDKNVQMQVDLQGREKKVSQELRLLLNAYQEFRKKFEPVIRNVHPTYLKLEDAIYTKKTELEELKKRKDAVEKEQKKQKSAKVVVTGNLYSGVSVEINGVIWRSEPMRNVYLVSRGNRIGSLRNV